MTASPQTGPTTAEVPPERPIRVLVADDHALMRRGLRLLLEADGGLEVVGEAGDLATAMRHVSSLRPGVLVIDLSMSAGSSLELVRLLRHEVPGMAIVVLTMEDSRVFAQAAVDAGAVGFVLKQAADRELVDAVRSAVRGERYLSPRLGGRTGPWCAEAGSYSGRGSKPD